MGFTGLATWEILEVSHQLKQRPIQTVKWLFYDWGESNWQASGKRRLKSSKGDLFGELGAFLSQVGLFWLEGSDASSDL